MPKHRKSKTEKERERAEKEKKEAEVGKMAKEALRKGLQSRLRTRVKMHQVARAGGTSQEVQSVLNRFNDGDDAKAELMRDIQDDVKGMKQKDAKKYLKQVLSGMNKDQADSFVDMVKDKMPAESSNIVNYVKRHRKIKEAEDKTKPQVNPETVYVPTRLMTEEQKIAERARRAGLVVPTPTTIPAADAPPSAEPPRKKKGFSRIDVHVPKITELKEHPPVEGAKALDEDEDDQPSKKKKEKKSPPTTTPPKTDPIATTIAEVAPPPRPKKNPFRVPSAVPLPPTPVTPASLLPRSVPATTTTGHLRQIEDLFPEQKQSVSKEEEDLKRLTYTKRAQNIQYFKPEKCNDMMRQFLFESASVVEVLLIKEVDFLPLPEMLEVPGTHEFIHPDTIPAVHRAALEKGSGQHIESHSTEEGWSYRKYDPSTDEKKAEVKYLRIRNAHLECKQFLQRFDGVRTWLTSLKGTRVPWQWLCELLNDLGILRQKVDLVPDKAKEWPEYFRVLCHEYHVAADKATVPIVPFMRLTLKC